MHPALRILEVLDNISLYVGQKSLPALASTCRAFENPALNVLWRNLESVEPIVKCLPSELFGTNRKFPVLQKPLDHKMWDTLSRYTSRVHSITQSRKSKFIELLSLIILSYPSAPTSFFPNLRQLTWFTDATTHDAAVFLRMALVPSLLSLTVQISPASPAFLSVFSSLGTLCPRLQCMTLDHGRSIDEPSSNLPFIMQPISQLRHLRGLDIWGVGIQEIQQIMLLGALQRLVLAMVSPSSAWDKPSPLQLPGFRNLRALTIKVNAFKRLMNFFSALTIVRTKKVTVRLTHPVTLPTHARVSTMFSEFLAILQERCDNNKLEFFTFTADITTIPEITEFGFFTSLRAFRNLTHLDIEWGSGISMSDKELCYLTEAWPKLQVLRICCCFTVDLDTITVPTFHGLICLLRLCPALTSLTLAIDATKLDGIDLKCPGGEHFTHHLKDLTLGNSIIDSPLNVALILSGLFPHLEQVNLDCWDTALLLLTYHSTLAIEHWVSVNDFLRGFSVVRERPRHIVS
ncbi:hypothetical protein CY34DRAFT_93075 [Suillus luteus UH-Slu-Lm8-n1]|uniref:Unplaced genomic scaffold CY34scaffold_335, whole genome shotgun sequence n=1 Tax=Suillus luteus UH-Slu-Lm8-n1 TaxID=930992 RepID=A0A0D0AGH8_9AGAM|nr:hypothetical protein CY34DRAFT_93075 [Suillus luteus UH-Slu-Lm8-n1]